MNQNNFVMPEGEFIDLVHQERALWDPNHQHYKDMDTKNAIWIALAEKGSSTAKDVRRRWTGLREKYRREKIYNSKSRKSGSTEESQRWSSFDKMAFLDDVYVPRGSYRAYRTEAMDMHYPVRTSDFSRLMNSVKQEDNSMDDEYDIGDYLETNVDCSSTPECLDGQRVGMYPSSAPPAIDQETHQFFSRLNRNQEEVAQNAHSWLAAAAKANARSTDGESSSTTPSSQQSDTNHRTRNLSDQSNVSRYKSFGLYIADTLDRLDIRHAHELHINILREIIKIQTKVANSQ